MQENRQMVNEVSGIVYRQSLEGGGDSWLNPKRRQQNDLSPCYAVQETIGLEATDRSDRWSRRMAMLWRHLRVTCNFRSLRGFGGFGRQSMARRTLPFPSLDSAGT